MPWKILSEDGKYCVRKEGGGDLAGCHPTRGEAEAQLRALYTNEAALVAAAAAGWTDSEAAAGLALVAEDTGRVLLIQRALVDGEPAGGLWEFPGGGRDDGEGCLDCAMREFAEEVGQPVPPGRVASTWLSPNGVYRGYVWATPEEASLSPDHASAAERSVDDPDNPDQSNYTEAVAWFDPAHLRNGPKMLRAEVRASTPWKLIEKVGEADGEEGLVAAARDVHIKVVPEVDWPALAAQAEEAGYVLALGQKEGAAEVPGTVENFESFESLVASLKPPTEALLPTEELPGPTPWAPSEDGLTADGHLALWASCHIGFPGCVKPPREESFDFYNLTPVLTASGEVVHVGRVTFGTGHAGGDLNWRTAAAHYDNSGTATYVAHAVPDRWGIRLPSVLLASASPEQVEQARVHPLSGDWRKIGGRLRLIASLGVNVPGYPVTSALVASGEVQTMFIGFDPADAAALVTEADALLEELGLDPSSKADALLAAVVPAEAG